MKAYRLLLPVLLLLLFSSTFAFAGPQLSVSDPQCDNSSNEIQLTSSSFSFTVQSSTNKLVFCNATNQNFSSLNFTIVFPTTFDLTTMYCGGPDNGSGVPAAFDFCNVLDPNNDNQKLLTFVAGVDTPSSFYQEDPSCTFGCSPRTPSVFGNSVEFQFGTFPSELSLLNENNCGAAGTGLVSGCRFTFDFNCPPNSVNCDPMPVGTTIAFLASTSNLSNEFPPPASVPEPASILLISAGMLPVVYRRVREKSRK